MTDAPPASTASGGAGPSHPWLARTWTTASGCLVADAVAGIDPLTVFGHAASLPHVLFLDSAAVEARPVKEQPGPLPPLGRWSFVAADPIHSIAVGPEADPAAAARTTAEAFAGMRRILAELATPTIPGLPPFQGGLAGLISYDCGLARLGLPTPPAAQPAVPLVSIHLYDVVFAYDHWQQRGWFISQGIPARGPVGRRERAATRLEGFLTNPSGIGPSKPGGQPSGMAASSADARGRPRAETAPGSRPPITTSHPPDRYREMVAAGIEAVLAGDVFQVNLAQRLSLTADLDPIAIHLAARRLNAAPFAACFDAGPAHLVSMSPERFLQAARGTVRMHPIKGTRRMLSSPEADLYAGADLGASDKDRAENVMIVDLVRNDLARVCLPESVRVEALCRLERFRYVQHLVSVVAGRLRPGLGPLDAIEAAIPAGSVTGAPKHRACEIISELEGTARGAYCGCLGYLGLDGTADFNLLIRTIIAGAGGVSFSAGGGITAASDPAAEHAESLDKAEGMLRVLEAVCGEVESS
jgi:para-aminobenzoate synthetase component 1